MVGTDWLVTLRARARSLRQVFGYLWPRLRPQLGRAIAGTTLSLLAALFGILSTLSMASLLEVLKQGGRIAPRVASAPSGSLWDFNTMGHRVLDQTWGLLGRIEQPAVVTWIVCASVILTITLAVLLSISSRWLWMTVRVRLWRQMQGDLFAHLLHLPMNFHVKQRIGSLISRLHVDVSGVAYLVPTLFDTLIRAPLLVTAFLWLLIQTNPALTMIAIGAAGLYLIANLSFGRLARRLVIAQSKSTADVLSIAQETLLSIRIVKSFSAEPREAARLQRAALQLARTELQVHLIEKELPEGIHRIVGIITIGLVGIAASGLVAHGQLTQGAMLLFLGATAGMLANAAIMGQAVMDLYILSGSAARVLDLWTVTSNIPEGPDDVPGFQRELAVRDVAFSYGETFALRDLSLAIKKGEVIGLVGPSGAGKSTLTDLLLRLYDPASGAIALDGADIRRFRTASYRSLFGVVSQESLLFNDTVRNNIAYGAPGIGDAEIERAARIANAHDFIKELPDGYDTLLGDRGVRLSGGQRQRIAIARAIVHRPAILIFDEATSSLDNESERLVQQAISRIIEQCTAIIVAHRLTTVQRADRIIVMDHGRIVQQGTHQQLMAQAGLYRRLYESMERGEQMGPQAPALEAAR